MPSCKPFDAMKVATESFDQDILRRASPTSLWMNAIPRGTFAQGVGTTQTTFVIANSEPTSDNENWTDITLTNGQITLGNDANTSGCDITYNQVEVGFTEQTYGPRQFGLKGPVICEDNLTFQHDAAKFLMAYETEMTKRAKRSWEFEMRRQYMLMGEKYGDGDLIGAALTPISAITEIPQSQLTQDLLDVVAATLIDGDATEPDSDGYVTLGETGPIFTLNIGVEASNRILKLDPELRADARFATMGKGIQDPTGLFARIGAARVIGNFRHAITTIPPRFDVIGGHLVQRNTFIMVDTTQGKKAVRNPLWINAEYEAAIVVLPTVFEAEIVKPMTGAGSFKFRPQNYMGEWEFVTGAYRLGLDCDDPLDKLGQHVANFKYAPRPMFPEHGKVIIFKRCPRDIELVYCA